MPHIKPFCPNIQGIVIKTVLFLSFDTTLGHVVMVECVKIIISSWMHTIIFRDIVKVSTILPFSYQGNVIVRNVAEDSSL